MKAKKRLIMIIVFIIIFTTGLLGILSHNNTMYLSERIVYIKDNKVYLRSSDWLSAELIYSPSVDQKLTNIKGKGDQVALLDGKNIVILNIYTKKIQSLDESPRDFVWSKVENKIMFLKNSSLVKYNVNTGEVETLDLSSVPNINELSQNHYRLSISPQDKYMEIDGQILDLNRRRLLDEQTRFSENWNEMNTKYIYSLSFQDMGGLFEYRIDNGNITKYKFPENISINSNSAIYESNSDNIYFILFNTIKLVDTSRGQIINTIKYDGIRGYLDLKFQSKGNKSFVATESIGDSLYKVINLTLDGKIKDATFDANEITWVN